jgi:hypothetical protein
VQTYSLSIKNIFYLYLQMKKMALFILLAVYGVVAFGTSNLQGYVVTQLHSMGDCPHGTPVEPAENHQTECINAFCIFTGKEHQHIAARTQFSSKAVAQQRAIMPGIPVTQCGTVAETLHVPEVFLPCPVAAYILHCVYRI